MAQEDDKKAALDFLNSPLGEGLSANLFTSEILAHSILIALTDKGLVDWHEVIDIYNDLLKNRLSELHSQWKEE